MHYAIFRLLLIEKPQMNLFPNQETRQAFLSRLLSDRLNFIHRNKQFSYVHIGTVDSCLFARLGRSSIEHVVDAPDTGFAVLEQEGHRAVNVLIETAGDVDGQKLAIQDNRTVGSPTAILESLQNSLNSNQLNPWHVEIKPVSVEETFWQAVDRYKNQITFAEFTLVAPNLFGLGKAIRDELKEANELTQATEVKLALKADDGLSLDTEKIRNATDYISQGGGDSILRRGKEVVYSSRRNIQREQVEKDEPIRSNNDGVWKRLRRALIRR